MVKLPFITKFIFNLCVKQVPFNTSTKCNYAYLWSAFLEIRMKMKAREYKYTAKRADCSFKLIRFENDSWWWFRSGKWGKRQATNLNFYNGVIYSGKILQNVTFFLNLVKGRKRSWQAYPRGSVLALWSCEEETSTNGSVSALPPVVIALSSPSLCLSFTDCA